MANEDKSEGLAAKESVVSLADLDVGIFRFTLVAQETLFVPAVNKANMLRGAFGHAFRRLCCVPQCVNARECPLAASCPYKAIFEPSPPPDADRLSANQDVPRPFVFRAPLTDKTKFQSGEQFQFDLVLIGRALDHLPYFVLAFREITAQGIGLNRAKCELKKVEELYSREDETAQPVLDSKEVPPFPLHSSAISASSAVKIFDSADQVFHSSSGLALDQWIYQRIQPLSGHRIQIRFLSPTWIKSESQVVRQPNFAHIIKRLRDRINALSTFFGPGPLEVDFAGLGARAEKVRTVSSKVKWVEQFRTSSKTRQRHELSGFVGEAVYEGDLTEFLPWLALGELVHVGKHTAWGMGRLALGNRQ